ncbi:MAG: DUF881 domain-containing protein [Chloroflexi bacterium]|nr:DUF881 domain-containing protein [Chloroflexota bacterium]
MRGKVPQICLSIVAIILGILLVMQLRTQGRIAKSISAQSATDQATIISNLYESNLNLRKEVDRLRQEQNDYDESLGQSELAVMLRETNKLRVVTGLSQVTGPGVQMTISADLRSEDLQDLINELRNAGAEAVAVNGQRVIVKTAVYQTASTVYIDGSPVGPPYVLIAIGQPDTLERALVRKGGLVTYLKTTYPDATITVLKHVRTTVPVYQTGYQWQYATPAPSP